MKSKILKYFCFILFAVLISSCCGRKYCPSVVDQINEIHLVNFTLQESDSIIIKTYQKNTSSMIDSSFTQAKYRTGTSDLLIFTPQVININLDYSIQFLSISKTYLITNFSIGKAACNSCFPSGNTYRDVLDSYYVNGQKQSDETIKITK